MVDYFDQPIAVDPTANDGEGALVPGAEFEVFAGTDLSFTTPLTVFEAVSGAEINPLVSSSVGQLPQFRVEGDPEFVVLKSGQFAVRVRSVFGAAKQAVADAGLGPEVVADVLQAKVDVEGLAGDAAASAGAASDSATAAGDHATTASNAADEANAAKLAVEGVVATNDGIMAPILADPETASGALVRSIAPDAAAVAMGNPESDLNVATVALIEEFAPDVSTSLRIVRESLTNLGAPRPAGVEPVIWLRPSDSLAQPTHFVPETDFIAAASVTPYTPPNPIEIFGSSLLAWWDERTTPPADGADYGTLIDRATAPHNMTPLVTGMTDVPQFDADGINGKACVYQPAISAMGVTGLSWGSGALTVITGVQLGAADGTAQYVTNGQNSGTAQFSIATNSGGTDWLIRRGGTVRTALPIQGSRTAPHALIATYNGDSSYFWDNGVKSSVIASPGTASPTAFKLGLQQDIATPTGVAPGARFVSPIIVNRAITDDEAALVTAFLKYRMGVS